MLAEATEARREVRRCGSCGKPTLIVTSAWQHSVNGVSTGMVTRDCQCQTCGAKVTLYPRWKIIPLWIITVLLLPTLIPPLVSGFMAFRRWRAWKNSPEVPGAVFPEIRFKSGPGNRRCSCGGTLVLQKVTRNSHNGMPTGTEYEYTCPGCSRQVTMESAGGIIMSVFGSFLLGGVAAGIYVGVESYWRWVGGGLMGVLALFLFLQAINRIIAPFKYPEMP